MIIIYIVTAFVAGAASGVLVMVILKKKGRAVEEVEYDKKIKELKEEQERILKRKEEEVKNEKERIKKEFEKETSETRQEFKSKRQENQERAKKIEQKVDIIENKEAELNKRRQHMEEMKKKYNDKEAELKEMREKEQSILRKISGLTPKQAREKLMNDIRQEAAEDAQINYSRIVENANRDAQREAKEVITRAIERIASDVTQDITVSAVNLPDDDMKGRIIGREGRNIRAFESATGVNVIIDDTPSLIVLSCFDGMRREIAKRALEKLIKDGRIQPTRIEEVVEETAAEVNELIIESGEEAAMNAGVTGLHNEEIRLLGKMMYRTSYGQNVLEHSVEVAKLAAGMAEELDLDVEFARRSGLLHDLGKAVDREIEGNHAHIGGTLVKKYGESDRLQNAVMSHHGDVAPETAEAVLIQAADAVSASRPGARREHLKNYIKRMKNIEAIANEHKGVVKAYCVSAGREIRIIVAPEKVTDLEAANISKECAAEIAKNIDFPGEIKVTVIRSTRTTEIAK
ncbi:MAG: ribonuclease Y [Elusimicrobia bacterium]|jgi:ribonuclease Y|nr:ribonuclease Y [Elusimicrobiota bacterium]